MRTRIGAESSWQDAWLRMGPWRFRVNRVERVDRVEGFEMATVKSTPPAPKRVWRITPEAPHGRFVDANDVPPPPVTELEHRDREGWAMSSFDLTYGLDVTEVDGEDTVPGALMDELFGKPGV